MRVLFLTNNDNAKDLYNWIREQELDIKMCEERIDLMSVMAYAPEIIVSYNYNFLIRKDVIDYMRGNIINLHISLLPWNRGFSPNIWSFIDNTPKGVTIHYIDEGLDTGDVIVQKEMIFCEEEETFATTYNRLNEEIQELFKRNWEQIKHGQIGGVHQSGEGSYHTMKDLKELQECVPFSWDDNIGEFMKRYRGCITENK